MFMPFGCSLLVLSSSIFLVFLPQPSIGRGGGGVSRPSISKPNILRAIPKFRNFKTSTTFLPSSFFPGPRKNDKPNDSVPVPEGTLQEPSEVPGVSPWVTRLIGLGALLVIGGLAYFFYRKYCRSRSGHEKPPKFTDSSHHTSPHNPPALFDDPSYKENDGKRSCVQNHAHDQGAAFNEMAVPSHCGGKAKPLNTLSYTNTASQGISLRGNIGISHIGGNGQSLNVVSHALPDAAARGNAFIQSHQRVPYNPQVSDLQQMTNPQNWHFIPPPASNYVVIEGHVVKFRPNGDADNSVTTNLPVPLISPPHNDINPPSSMLYYEVSITAMHPKAAIAIGLATSPYPPFRLPGWHDWSVGYHSDDGRIYVSNDGDGAEYNKPYRVDDTIGVGVDTECATVFFTRNGVLLPNISTKVALPGDAVYPCIGAFKECSLRVNFGVEPYRWVRANELRAVYALELLPTYSLQPAEVPSLSSSESIHPHINPELDPNPPCFADSHTCVMPQQTTGHQMKHF